jgi:dihydroneopterin aldolase
MALKRGIKMEDIIYIKDLRIKTIIGIFDWERKVKQEVSIDMEFPFDCKKAAATDTYRRHYRL